MDRETFNSLAKIVYDSSGIFLREGKEALIAPRIGKRMRALGMNNYRDYIRFVKDNNNREEVVHMLDAISTNVTDFFRENSHFEFLRDAFTEWAAEGQRRFRFWSAASSSGEEPYSMAISIREATNIQGLDIKILATDISTRVLDICRQGIYEKEKVKSVPPLLCKRYFDCECNGTDTVYKVKDDLKQMIVFKRLNLSNPPFPMRGPLDAVFCRNVMIYFDTVVREKLLAEIFRLLKPGGYLIVGHAESLTNVASHFTLVKPAVYIKTK